MATGADGHIVIGGGFQQTIAFDGTALTSLGGVRDGFVASLDAEGKVLWAIQLGGDGEDSVLDVAIDPGGNIYASGLSNGALDLHDGQGPVAQQGDFDGFLVKLDASGKTLWSKRFRCGGTEIGWSVVPRKGGGVIVGGSFGGSLDLGGGTVLESTGKRAALLAAYDDGGALLWGRRFDGPGEEQIMEIAQGPDGDIWAQGPYTSPFALDTIEVPYDANEAENLFLARFDAEGKAKQGWSFRGKSREVSLDLAVGPDGAVLLPLVSDSKEDVLGPEAGPALGFFDMGLLLLDGEGKTRWAKRLGSAGPDGLFGAAFAADGSLLLSGAYGSGFSLAGQPLDTRGLVSNLLMKLTPSGEPLWWWAPGPTDLVQVESFNSVAVEPTSGAVVTAGRFIASIDGIGGSLASKGKNDIYVARFAP